jgi:uncharacterized protein YdbL (DUF1318 family)
MKTAWAMRAVLTALVICGALAAGEPKVDLNVQNPAIQALQKRMNERAAKIEQWKDKGAIGEEVTGLVKQLAIASHGLAEKKEVRDLVVAENEGRYALFRELVLANNLQEKNLDAVASAYAKTKRQNAAASHFVQDPASKEWVKKQDLKP